MKALIIMAILLTGCMKAEPPNHRVIPDQPTLDKCSTEFIDCLTWTYGQEYRTNGLRYMAEAECVDYISDCGDMRQLSGDK